jgi:hypothetical protein
MIYQVLLLYSLHYLAFQNHLQEPAVLILNLLQLVRLIKLCTPALLVLLLVS